MKPKWVWKAASKAALFAAEPAAVKSLIGWTSVLMPANIYSPLTLVLRMEVTRLTAVWAAVCVTVEATPLPLSAVRVGQECLGQVVYLAERVLGRRQAGGDASLLESTMPVQPVDVARKRDGLAGARAERQAEIGELAGVDLLLRLGQMPAASTGPIAHRVGDGLRGDEGRLHAQFIASMRADEHVVDRRDQARRRLVGMLEVEQHRHLHRRC